MKYENNQDLKNLKDILVDVNYNGKIIDWKNKKIRSIYIADSFRRIGINNVANNIKWCGSSLAFAVNSITGEKKLFSANFCKQRLCPMCQWRKSLKVFHQVSLVMDKLEFMYPGYVPIFLTLTVKNCSGDMLSSVLYNMFNAFHKLLKRKEFKQSVKGFFRALEVTYNKFTDDFHPHFHCILIVDKSYFSKKNNYYLKTADWVRLWRSCLGVDYDPVCFVEKIRTNKGKHKAVSEVAKYTLKDTDFTYLDPEDMDPVVSTLYNSLSYRRLFSFGGVLKDISKKFLKEDAGEGDLINVSEDSELRRDIYDTIVVYRWHFGFSNYYKSELSSLTKQERDFIKKIGGF